MEKEVFVYQSINPDKGPRSGVGRIGDPGIGLGALFLLLGLQRGCPFLKLLVGPFRLRNTT